MPELRSPTGKAITLKPVRPNAGIQAAYRKKLLALVKELHDSVHYWVTQAYKANEPEMAQDASPAAELRDTLKKLAARWEKSFAVKADALAKWSAQKVKDYSDSNLKQTLKEAGFTVEFKMTPVMQDAYSAVIGEQVGLIKSIAAQHLTQVETIVMQSVQNGRDLKFVSDALQAQFGVTKRRAELIARDQNNKATATLTKVRQKGLGITQAIWMHSHGGKTPRPEHVKADGEIYDIDKGMYLEGKWTWPGVEINCRCVSKSIIPGL